MSDMTETAANKPKIRTEKVHATRNGEWFSVEIDGRLLVGANGFRSLFPSRKAARDEALRRLDAGL